MKNANIGSQKDRGEKGEKEITVNLTEGCFFFFSALNSEYKLNQTVKLDICLVTSSTWSVSFAFWCFCCHKIQLLGVSI